MHRRLFLLPLILIALAGCAAREDAARDRWLPPDQLRSTWNADTSPSLLAVATGDGGVILPDHAGPDDYVRLALQRNPAIAAAEYRVEAAAARIPQETTLDDPMLELAPLGRMGDAPMVMAGVSQSFPFPGKLDTRGDLAATQVAQAAAEMTQIRLQVEGDVRSAYWSYYFATQAIDVTTRTRQLLDQLRQVADSQFRAGRSEQSDVLRAGVELSGVDNELISLEQQKTSAIAMLNSLLDRPLHAPLPSPLPADLRTVDLRLQNLLAAAAATNPELEAIRHRMDTERQRQALARLQRYPDLTVRLSYTYVDETDMMMEDADEWALGFGINLPIWFDKYRAAEREALRGRQAAVADLGAAQNRVAFRVQDALVRVESQQRQVQLFGDTIIPQARQAVESARAGYQSGRVPFLMVVDNWRQLLSYELLYHQNLAQLEKDFAELEQMVGGRVERVAATQPAGRGANRL